MLFLVVWPVLVGDQTFFYRDLYRQHVGTARLLNAGPLPNGLLWDPLVNGGQPLLANPNRFLLYPSRLLYLFLAPLSAISWEIALHLLLGGLGMTLLSRRFGTSRAGSAVAGIAFSVGGLSISLTNHLGRLLAFQWLPWILLAAHAGFCERAPGSWRWRAALPVLLAVQWLTGAAELAVMAAVIVVGWVVVVSGVSVRGNQRVMRVLGLVILGIGLAAIQVVPAAEMVLRSERALVDDSEGLLTWSLHPLRAFELVVPGFCGPVDVADPSSRYWGSELVDFGFPYLLSLYLGASAVFLAGIGWVGSKFDSRWRSWRWPLVGMALGGLVIACGRYLPLLGDMLLFTPGIDLLRFPVKALLFAALPAALLAGRGVDVLCGAGTPAARRGAAAAALSASGFLAIAAAVKTGISGRVLEFWFGDGAQMAAGGLVLPLVHTGLALLGVGVAAMAATRLSSAIPALLLGAVVSSDLLAAAALTLPMAPAQAFPQPPEMAQKLLDASGGGRFVRDVDPADVLVPLTADRAWASAAWWYAVVDGAQGANWGLPMIYHSDAEVLAGSRMALLARTVPQLDWAGRLPFYRMAAVGLVMTPESPDIEGLKIIGSEAAAPNLVYRLYRTEPSPTMLWWVGKDRIAGSPTEALAGVTAPDFDPLGEVVREAGVPTAPARRVFPRRLVSVSEIWRGEIHAPAKGFLVAAIPWHPDLIVEVNGRVIAAERVNYAFTGFEIERGRYDVRILFAPRMVFWGGLISIVSLAVWVTFVVASWRMRRMPGGSGI